MKKSVFLLMSIIGALALPQATGFASPMSLDISSALNYDAVGTTNEINWVNAHYPTGNHRLADILGGHNLANSYRAFTSTASLTSGTALPPFGVIGNYAASFAYDLSSGGQYVASPNCLRIIATATSGAMVTASGTVTLDSVQQLNYSDLNLLFVQDRSTSSGTFRTVVTATYTDGTTTILDTGTIGVATNVPGGTLGSAGVASQGGLSISTDTNSAVTNVFTTPYGVTSTGSAGNFSSVISSTAGSNLWQLTTPITLNSAKVLKAVSFQVQAAQTGQWNELAVFGLCATPSYYAAPPATDPVQALNVTFLSGTATHPRIMMTPQTISSLQAFYNSPSAAIWDSEFNGYLGSCTVPVNTNFLTDATEAQRQGLWRLPTIALDYVLTGNMTSYNNCIGFLQLYVALPDWETSTERNSGMAAANNMVGVALAYDWLYNSLDPTFRETVRQKLFAQARALYYGGFLQYNSNIAAIYWQLDPLTNQRWHRDAGLALAVMASYNGDPSENWLMNQTAAEMAFVAKWLPPDGTSHESVSYQVFGSNHLTMAMQASDDCLGTHLLDTPFFSNAGPYRLEMELSSLDSGLDFGDFTNPDEGSYNNYLLKLAAHTQNADLRSGILALFGVSPSALDFSWFSLLWDDPTLTGGNYQNLPLINYSSDLGLASFRDSWAAGGVAAMFKCSPLGGISLNQYRDQNGYGYVNVAHDDPDANSFIIYCGEDPVAATDQYSQQKNSTQQNTILVNGGGQFPTGRTDAPQVFEQPATSGDMLAMATSFPQITVNGATIEEGEAAGSYPAIVSGTGTRPAISRFRRLFVWSPNKYVMVLDDLRSPQSANFTWLVQGPGVTTVNSSQGLFNLTGASHTCGFQIIASQPLTFVTGTSTADNRGVSLGYEQLQASVSGTSVQIASVFNPWQKTNLGVTLQNATSTGCDVYVNGTGVSDKYHWTFATGSQSPSSLGPPVITSSTSATATEYQPFNYNIAGSNGATSYSAGGLPAGLNASAAGLISGTPTVSGTFNPTLYAVNTTGTGSASLAITVQSPYALWQNKVFTPAQLAVPSICADNANPAGDGIPNLMKYALGLNPNVAYSGTSPGIPYSGVTSSGSKEYLTLTFTGTSNDVTYSVQATSNLTGTWSTLWSSTLGQAPGTVTLSDTIPISLTPRRFMQLQVTGP